MFRKKRLLSDYASFALAFFFFISLVTMSKLQKSVMKQNSSLDFTAELNSKLNQLTISPPSNANGNSQSNKAINSIKTPVSPSSPLSRQESRQNSLISTIINPDDENNQQPDEIFGIDQLISSLSVSNKLKLTVSEREIILSHLYRMLINDPNDVYLSSDGLHDELFLEVFNLSPPESNSFQWNVWLRCLLAMVCIDIDSIGDEVIGRFLPYLLKFTLNVLNGGSKTDDIDFNVEALKLKSFSICLLIIYHQGENHSMLKNVAMMMLLLQSDLELPNVMVSSICDVLSVSLGLAFDSGRDCNDIIFGTLDDVSLLELIDILLVERKSNKALMSKLTQLTTVCFECVNFDENINVQEEFEPLWDKIKEFNNQGVKKVGKSSAASSQSPNVTSLCLKFMIDDKKVIFTSFPLSKTKFIKVKSMIIYTRLELLKFILLGHVRVWLTKNSDMRDMLKLNPNNHSSSANADNDGRDDSDDEDFGFDTDDENSYNKKRLSNKERTKLISRERQNKSRGTELDLDQDDY